MGYSSNRQIFYNQIYRSIFADIRRTLFYKSFLCGGGAGIQTIKANKRLNEVIDHSEPCLYVPLAMGHTMYADCYKWIKGELKNVDIPHIEMVNSIDELAAGAILKQNEE